MATQLFRRDRTATNAELERARELQAGMNEAEETIQLPPRDTKKMRRERHSAAAS